MPLITEFHVLDTGFCRASEHHVIRGGARKSISCHALIVLLRHSEKGWILFDTGYAPRFLNATRRFPFRLYRWITPVATSDKLSAVNQLSGMGIASSDVSHIIVSHFHADHVAGLLDFPQSRIVAAFAAYDHFRKRRGLAAVRKAYLPSLVPDDLPHRADWVTEFDSPSEPGLGPTHDLFKDGSIRIVHMPGHARGQIGAIFELAGQAIFLAADGCWMRQSYLSGKPPHWITHAVIDNVAAMHDTLRRIQEFRQTRPETVIIPCHCPEVFQQFVRRA